MIFINHICLKKKWKSFLEHLSISRPLFHCYQIYKLFFLYYKFSSYIKVKIIYQKAYLQSRELQNNTSKISAGSSLPFDLMHLLLQNKNLILL